MSQPPASHQLDESSTSPAGVDRFIAATSTLATQFAATPAGTRAFISTFAAEHAYIRMRDLTNPLRFLKQMEGAPPVQWGTSGFRVGLVDDLNPARHYAAFIFVGYWLPMWLSVLVLWLWEFAGFVRYGFTWSQPDVRSGYLGIWHGRLIRAYDHRLLPSLMARDLTARGKEWSRLSQNGRRVRELERRDGAGA